MCLSVIFFALSITIWKTAAVDINVYDTYYIISSLYVAICCTFLVQINYMLYRLIGHKEGTWNYWILVTHLVLFLISFTLLTGCWFALPYIQYLQYSLMRWAGLTLIFSELLILVYYFNGGRKAGRA